MMTKSLRESLKSFNNIIRYKYFGYTERYFPFSLITQTFSHSSQMFCVKSKFSRHCGHLNSKNNNQIKSQSKISKQHNMTHG